MSNVSNMRAFSILLLLFFSISNYAQIREEVVYFSGYSGKHKITATGILEYQFTTLVGPNNNAVMKARWKRFQITSIRVDGKYYAAGKFGDVKLPYESTGILAHMSFKTFDGQEHLNKGYSDYSEIIGTHKLYEGWEKIYFDIGINYSDKNPESRISEWAKNSTISEASISKFSGGTADVLARKLKAYAFKKDKNNSISERIKQINQRKKQREKKLLDRSKFQRQPNFRDQYNRQINQGFTKLGNLIGKLSSDSQRRKENARKFAEKMNELSRQWKEEGKARRKAMRFYKDEHIKELNDLLSRLRKQRFDGGALRVSRAIELAKINNIPNVYVLPIRIESTSYEQKNNWHDRNDNNLVDANELGLYINIESDLRPKAIKVSDYSYANRSKIQNFFVKSDCVNCYQSGFNKFHIVLVAFDYQSLYEEFENVLNNKEYLFTVLKKRNAFRFDFSSDNGIQSGLEKQDEKNLKLDTDKAKVSRMLTGSAFITNDKYKLIVNKGKFILAIDYNFYPGRNNEKYSSYYSSQINRKRWIKIKRLKGSFKKVGYGNMVFRNKYKKDRDLFISQKQYAITKSGPYHFNSSNGEHIFFPNPEINYGSRKTFQNYIVIGEVKPYLDSYRLIPKKTISVAGGLMLVGKFAKQESKAQLPGSRKNEMMYVYNMTGAFAGWYSSMTKANEVNYITKQYLNPRKVPSELSFTRHSSKIGMYHGQKRAYLWFDTANYDNDFNYVYNTIANEAGFWYFGDSFVFKLNEK